MNRHPEPTSATVKALYGTATSCAEPTCSEPLYRDVAGSSKAALNSTIAHIRAASPQGPRYSDKMTAEENRSSSNLLLLCPFHARVIDTRAELFPVDLLRRWKSDQLRQGDGLLLDDAQIDEVLKASVRTDLLVQAEVINLGGQWGGGGGAIGGDAIGGRGGDQVTINLDGSAPGGGGGSISGPGRTPPDANRAKVGVAFVPGTDGGDTSFGQGAGAVLIQAEGGHAPGSPYDQRQTTDDLRVSSLMVCNYSEIRDGLLFSSGGAWSSLALLNTPVEVPLPVQVVIEAGGVAVGHYSVRLTLTDSAGDTSGEVRFPVVVEEEGDLVRLPMLINMSAKIKQYGVHKLTLASDTNHLAAILLSVRRVTDSP